MRALVAKVFLVEQADARPFAARVPGRSPEEARGACEQVDVGQVGRGERDAVNAVDDVRVLEAAPRGRIGASDKETEALQRKDVQIEDRDK